MKTKVLLFTLVGLFIGALGPVANATDIPNVFKCELILTGKPSALKLRLQADPNAKTSPGNLNLKLALGNDGQVYVLVPQDLYDAAVATSNVNGFLGLVGMLHVRKDLHAKNLNMTIEQYEAALKDLVQTYEALVPEYKAAQELEVAPAPLRNIPSKVLRALDQKAPNAKLTINFTFAEMADFDHFKQQLKALGIKEKNTFIFEDSVPYLGSVSGKPATLKKLLSLLTESKPGAVTIELPAVRRSPKR
jgi:hypothetical protein